jgi:hypothetical protein
MGFIRHPRDLLLFKALKTNLITRAVGPFRIVVNPSWFSKMVYVLAPRLEQPLPKPEFRRSRY